jgi:predicted dehydrogenase
LQVGYLQQTANLVLTNAGISYDVVDHWLGRFADAYLNEIRSFVGAVLAGKPVWPTADDGRRALAVALAAEQSYRQSRPVELAIGVSRSSSTGA